MRPRSIDFLRPHATNRVGAALLTLGAAALLISIELSQRWAAQRTHAEEMARTAEARRLAALRPPPAPKPTVEQVRWQQTDPERRWPWLAALRAIESATAPPIYLLGLTVDPVTGFVKIEGEAPSFDHAQAYVQVLGDGQHLGQVVLASHEQTAEPGSGRPFVRFTATTRWIAP